MDPAHPPSVRGAKRVRRVAVSTPSASDDSLCKGSGTRRGRISHETYLRVVGKGLTQDWYALDHCEVLTQLELVDQLVKAYPKRFLTKGAAVRGILDKAMDQVIAACRESSDHGSERIVTFLEARTRGESVADIAREWGLSREYVSRRVGRQAIELVTARVVAIGRRTLVLQAPREAAVVSSGKQSA